MTVISAPSALPQSDIRTLEEIADEAAAVPGRRAAFERGTVVPLRAAVAAEKQTYEAALVAAVRRDRQRPSRESLDKAELALRRAEEELAAFDQVMTDLAQERQQALGWQKQARRAANIEEIARRKAEQGGLKAAADAAHLAWVENENRIQNLQIENNSA